MRPNQKINDRIIYFCDIELNIFKEVIRKKGKYKIKVKSERQIILKDELWESKPLPSGEAFFMGQLRNKIHLTEIEKFEIKKIILKKELTCSIYAK